MTTSSLIVRPHRPSGRVRGQTVASLATAAACSAVATLLLLVAPSASDAALPTKGARYAGRTAQGLALSIRVSRRTNRRITAAEVLLRSQCGSGGRIGLFAVDLDVRVGRDGSFSSTDIDAESADLDAPLFDVTRYQLTGKFVSSRRVTGTWRGQSAIFNSTTFPTDATALDRCDTAAVTWTARRR